MIKRDFWENRIKEEWTKTSIVWLSGVRRAGKTVLSKLVCGDNCVYIDCDIPVSNDILKKPELFFKNCEKPIIVFDEIHQLRDPAVILKIGADMFPHLKFLVTGSSTLFAGKKFRDTLTGRKRNVHLLPVMYNELDKFNVSLERRLLNGGLPPAMMSEKKDFSFYREWSDSFFSRDIQKLFGLKDYHKFNIFFEYLMVQSGGMLEISKVSSEVGIARQTVGNYMRILELTETIRIVRPFFAKSKKEIVKMPKVYSFDTGFVSFFRNWYPLRDSDKGVLWEHIVLEWLIAINPYLNICYWRDKSGNEIDFVIQRDRENIDIFECKWNAEDIYQKAVKKFRELYPSGKNFIISPVPQAYKKEIKGLIFEVMPPFLREN